MMNDNEDLPSAGMDPFASPVKSKRSRTRSPWSRWLITTGGLFSLPGCVVGIGATIIQYGVQEDWEGFYAFMSLCPLPCILVGVILLVAGALPLVRHRQIDHASSTMDSPFDT
jgi:hypothetical protein